MINFNELTITPDGKHLIIDVSVKNEPYYVDTVLRTIMVVKGEYNSAGSYEESDPNVHTYEVPEDYSSLDEQYHGRKNYRLVISSTELNGLDDIFFVYVTTNGAFKVTGNMPIPCGADDPTRVGTVVNMYPFYQQAMNYIKELSGNCSIPQNFIDYLLRLKGLGLAIDTGNYPEALNFYNKYFKNRRDEVKVNGGCGCGYS